MQEHDNPFSEAAQRLSHSGYALASVAEQHARRTAMRTHGEAAQREKATATVNEPATALAPAAPHAAVSRETTLAVDKSAAALAEETYPHALVSVDIPSSRAQPQLEPSRVLRSSAAHRDALDSTTPVRR